MGARRKVRENLESSSELLKRLTAAHNNQPRSPITKMAEEGKLPWWASAHMYGDSESTTAQPYAAPAEYPMDDITELVTAPTVPAAPSQEPVASATQPHVPPFATSVEEANPRTVPGAPWLDLPDDSAEVKHPPSPTTSAPLAKPMSFLRRVLGGK
jgi:hypothetical protein